MLLCNKINSLKNVVHAWTQQKEISSVIPSVRDIVFLHRFHFIHLLANMQLATILVAVNTGGTHSAPQYESVEFTHFAETSHNCSLA